MPFALSRLFGTECFGKYLLQHEHINDKSVLMSPDTLAIQILLVVVLNSTYTYARLKKRW